MDNINIFVEGDSNGFNSQNAKFKFKQFVKQHLNTSFLKGQDVGNLETLCSRFVKSDYELKFISYKDSNITVKLTKKPELKKESISKRDMLKAKIKMLSDKRTNINYHKAKASNVPDDLLDVYKKASNECTVPIPEPSEIIKNPEQYKMLIQMMISTPEFKTKNSAYFKYFKMLGDLLGVEPLTLPTNNNNSSNNTTNNNDTSTNILTNIVDVKGETTNKDTDTEEDD
jgi:hypothetical protein